MSQDIPPHAEERARLLFGDLIEGRWEKAQREFDVALREHVDANRIAHGWTRVAGPLAASNAWTPRPPASPAITPW